MTVQITKWGNSLAVRIPKAVAELAEIHEGTYMRFQVIDGAIVLTPEPRKRYSLNELLEGMTEENLHGEISTGAIVGNEEW
ncbi:AbrB/MazE/SpoVT family DNA-binding domain-containing protein [Tumidithrix helvetica PCC 7403]|uniref:AbrB/MazE/SpoVT family DNA-binding domain-containing protein n=1 Tax=Tumidithrix elongata BACA0141 TaxID=2716417 RepID=A0AAW9PXZ9_9CYAN|nr:AbrB/MazE/SpoVT family DNA-binding domain-containing protein [Tumidithrix elongata RA019]